MPRYGLRTRADYDLLQGLATKGEIRPQGVATLKRHWEGLLASRWVYDYDRDLADGEDPDGEQPEYLVLAGDDGQGGLRRRQMMRIESPHAEIFRLGYTVSDVEQAIADLEAI
ncbi:hypothetical protein [Desulfobulbus elongatus]|uniref:hypothetical protein n=1 Tax=Desulfobulbus elongatus TaxID=53332 RepID=UPI0012FBF88D|nr:hypothetical protein [Desulfobulbus elongatus]